MEAVGPVPADDIACDEPVVAVMEPDPGQRTEAAQGVVVHTVQLDGHAAGILDDDPPVIAEDVVTLHRYARSDRMPPT